MQVFDTLKRDYEGRLLTPKPDSLRAILPFERDPDHEGQTIMTWEMLSYDMVMRWPSDKTAVDERFEALKNGTEYYTDILLLHGGSLGTIATIPLDPGSGPNYGSAKPPIVQISRSTFSREIWVEAQNSLVDIVSRDGKVRETLVTCEGLIDSDQCLVRFSKVGSSVPIQAGDRIVLAGLHGSPDHGLSARIRQQAERNTSTIPIEPSYQTLDLGGSNLTLAALFAALDAIAPEQKEGEDAPKFIGLMHPNQICDLLDENAALVQEVPRELLVLKLMTGRLTLELHSIGKQKQGQCYIIGADSVRAGLSDLDLEVSNREESPRAHYGWEGWSAMRITSNQSVKLKGPALLVTGIQNTFDSVSVGDVS